MRSRLLLFVWLYSSNLISTYVIIIISYFTKLQ